MELNLHTECKEFKCAYNSNWSGVPKMLKFHRLKL